MATNSAHTSPGDGAARRRRSVRESLGAIVLIFESVVMFLGSLAIFGLKALPAEQALVGGAVLVLALFITAGLLRWTWGVVLGSVLQALVLSTGFFVPAMWFVGGLFAILWSYAIYTGASLDRQKPRGDAPATEKDMNA